MNEERGIARLTVLTDPTIYYLHDGTTIGGGRITLINPVSNGFEIWGVGSEEAKNIIEHYPKTEDGWFQKRADAMKENERQISWLGEQKEGDPYFKVLVDYY